MAQFTYLRRSDYWTVQMDGPEEDHNQKENRGKKNSESWERHSFFPCAWTAIQCLILLSLSFVAKKMNKKNKLSLPQRQT